jgi:hypothetical protein
MTTRPFRAALALALLVVFLGCAAETDPSDPTPVINLSDLELTLTEGTAAETVTVALDAPPAGEVTVTLTSTPGIQVAPTTLHFSAEDPATPRQVVITPSDDDDVVARYDTITVAAEGLGTVTATVTTTDDDYLAILTTKDALAFTEGDTIEIGVSLSHRPPGPIVVEVGLPPNFAVRYSTDSITITPDDYATPVTLTLIADPDVDVVDDSTYLQLMAAAIPLVEIPLKVADPDTMRILVDPASLILEEGDTATVHVSLSHRPIGPALLTLAALDTTAVAVIPTQLMINPGGYNVPVNVFVVARQEVDAAGEISPVRIILAGIDTAQVGVRVNDDDELAIVVDDAEHALAVGDSVTVQVSLSAFNLGPADSLVVAVESQTPGIVSVAPATRVFTAQNYATPVPVRIKGVAAGGGIRGIVRLRAPNYDDAIVLIDVN